MIEWLARLIPLFPLLACLTTLLLGARVLKEKSHWPAIIGCGLASVCSLALLACVANSQILPQAERTVPIYTWAEIAGPQLAGSQDAAGEISSAPLLDISIALRVDSLSATMLAMLTFVATLVAIYASGYMHGDPGYWRFFTEVSLFVFSMIMLVLSANFVQLFMSWEAVGLCSYLLVGFWYEKPAAAAAGKKAFLVNRIGDFGFMIGVFLIWSTFGTVDFADVLVPSRIAALDPRVVSGICLCLFAGAVGKSAQFPLHVWLPDAMEGPTPVSALIHAATMVTAGVYMVARCTPLFQAAPDAQIVVSFVGGFTALLAALIALTQYDLKRVLAYSTVSQLGYMFLGLGTGTLVGVSGAMFHLVTHAFFKALLFLGAGSVMHAMGGIIDMRKFGGLKNVMPQTYVTFFVGALALAGLPPLSGFFSKDTILSAAREASHVSEHAGEGAGDGHPGADTPGSPEHDIVAARPAPRFLGLTYPKMYGLLYWMGTFTALLTAFYTFRAFFMAFHGPEKIPHEAGHHAHESPPAMCLPLFVLATGAALLGLFLGHFTGLFDTFLDKTIHGVHAAAEQHGVDWFVMGVSTLAALVGIGAAYLMYGMRSSLPDKLAALFGPLTDLSRNKFYLDDVYQILFVLPLRGLAEVSRFVDWFVIDIVLVGGVSKLPALVGRLPRPIQNGLVQFYALAMMLAMAVLLWALLSRQG